jgi:hypothetical protein
MVLAATVLDPRRFAAHTLPVGSVPLDAPRRRQYIDMATESIGQFLPGQFLPGQNAPSRLECTKSEGASMRQLRSQAVAGSTVCPGLVTALFVMIDWLSAGTPLALGQQVVAPEQSSPRMTAQATAEGIWILDDGRRVLFYQQAAKDQNGRYRRAHYIHPLLDLEGRAMSEDFPADHPHHRGIFWAWHQVLAGDKPAGDAWATQDFDWEVLQADVRQPAPDLIVLRSRVHWKSPDVLSADGKPVPLAEETLYLTVHAAADDQRMLDFEIRLRALRDDIRIGGSDDDKGYGGFSARVRLSPDTRFLGRNGSVEPQRDAVPAGPWLDIVHPEFGLAMLAHPSLPTYPPPWILRQARSMQNAVFPGREPVPLSSEQPLVLRYRLVVHRGAGTTQQVPNWHADYIRQPPVDWEPQFAAPPNPPPGKAPGKPPGKAQGKPPGKAQGKPAGKAQGKPAGEQEADLRAPQDAPAGGPADAPPDAPAGGPTARNR